MTEVPGLDPTALSAWLRSAHPELAEGELTATVIAGGRSNLTYAIEGARVPLILRRPPLGHVLSSAHDMRREHRVISALAPTAVPVPIAIALVDDTAPGTGTSGGTGAATAGTSTGTTDPTPGPATQHPTDPIPAPASGSITGTVFFLMERAPGTVLARPSQNADYTPAGLRALSADLARTLADLHAVDPATVGLADFGRPDGYLDRQLSTWRRQLDASRSRDTMALDALQSRLQQDVPAMRRTGIVHGDYRLDNALVTGTEPRLSAILDWEMATLGDPLVDLGMFALYWDIARLPGAFEGVVPSAVDQAAGYPEFDELVDIYAERAGIGIPDLGWYRAFAAYKLAVILEGIHYRFQAGDTVGEGFDHIGDLVDPLARQGLDTR